MTAAVLYLYHLCRTSIPLVSAHVHYLHSKRSTLWKASCCRFGTLLSHIAYITYTQILPNTPHFRIFSEIWLKYQKYMSGMRLLPNPNKYGCEQLLLSIEYSKVGVVGAFLAYKIQFAPIKCTVQ